MRLALWLLPCVCGCLLPDGSALDCERVALRSSDGSVDQCDDAACGSCVGTCGGACVLLDDDPPRYSCGEYESWSANDLCENWFER